MKKALFVLSVLAICGFVVGCGSSSNPCVELGEISISGFEEACNGESDNCCFCKCFNDGHKTYDATAYAADGTCTCEDPGGGGDTTCEGTDKEAAEACLADQACKDAAKATGVSAGEAGCTATPLQ
jgi:hypothetical protein